MKKLKWIITGVVAVLVAVMVAGYVILSTMDFEDLRETIQAEARAATGRELIIAGPIDLKISLTPAIQLEQVTFANAEWGSRPEMVTLERFEVEVALMPLFSGDIEVRRLVIVRPDILLETNSDGLGNWSLEGIEEAVEEADEPPEPGEEEKGVAGLPILHQVIIEDGHLTYRDGQTGEEMRVALTSFKGSAEGPTHPLTLELEGAYNDAPIKLAGTLGAFAKLAEGPFPVDLTAEAGGATVEVNGVIAQPMAGQGVDLKIAARGQNLADLGAVAGAELPPLGPYDVATRVQLDGDTVALSDLAAKVGGSDIAGQVTLAMGGTRPSVSGALTSQLLDVADFAPPAAAEGEAEPLAEAPASPYVCTEETLPLDGLKAADANLKLTVATLRLQEKMEFKDFDLTLNLDNGHLVVAPLLTTFANGKIEANVDLDGAKPTPTLVTAVKGAGIDYGMLLKNMEIVDDMQGTLDLDIDLRGAGGSMRAIAAGLNGKTEIVSGEGVISNKVLKIAGAGLSDIMGPLMGEEKDAKLNCIVSRFNVENGVATSQAMIFDSEAFTVTGGGTVDLRSEKLDLNMDTATREVSIASLAVPFNIGGTLKSPTFAPDAVGTALGAAKVCRRRASSRRPWRPSPSSRPRRSRAWARGSPRASRTCSATELCDHGSWLWARRSSASIPR
jgi:uncharacterized protein involved in outer membrane biogenesis